jgi:hypothetical protein
LELRPLRQAAGCQSVLIRDVRRAAAEISTEDRPDGAGRRVAVDHRDELGRALPPDAFLAERPVDSDRARKAVRVVKGIVGLEQAVPRENVARRERTAAQFQRDLPLPDAASEARQVAEALPRGHLIERAPSDV